MQGGCQPDRRVILNTRICEKDSFDEILIRCNNEFCAREKLITCLYTLERYRNAAYEQIPRITSIYKERLRSYAS